MEKRVIATVIYEIIFWGIYLSFWMETLILEGGRSGFLALIIYAICMPVFFCVICEKAINEETPDTDKLFQFIVQNILNVIVSFIAFQYISSKFGDGESFLTMLCAMGNCVYFAGITAIITFR